MGRPRVFTAMLISALFLPTLAALDAGSRLAAQTAPLPGLHHVQLNTVDAEAAVDWYLRAWPDAEPGEVAGMPAVRAEMLLLFRQVDEAPPGAFDARLGRSEPQSAFWHIGAFVNTTFMEERLKEMGALLLPLYTWPGRDEQVWRSGLVPYIGMRTEDEMSEETTVQPRPGGFGYALGPDGALVEFTGGPRTPGSFSHVHFFHERPRCAANWYVEHLGMALPPTRGPDGAETPTPSWDPCDADVGPPTWPSLERGGTIRSPRAGVAFANGSMSWYPRQCAGDRCGGEQPFAPSRGQVLDHVAFTVQDLERLFAHLQASGVTILETLHPFGDTRAFMIQDPDGLAVELVGAEGAPPLLR